MDRWVAGAIQSPKYDRRCRPRASTSSMRTAVAPGCAFVSAPNARQSDGPEFRQELPAWLTYALSLRCAPPRTVKPSKRDHSLFIGYPALELIERNPWRVY